MGKKGQIPWNKGKSLGEKHRENLSKAHMGKPPPNKGQKGRYKHPPETIKKMSELAKARGFGKSNKGKRPHNYQKTGLHKWSEVERQHHLEANARPENKEKARAHGIKTSQLRHKPTKPEIKVSKILSPAADKLMGDHPTLGYYLGEISLEENIANICNADFYMPELRLVVFVDGCYSHGCPTCRNGKFVKEEKTRKDRWVDEELKAREYNVLRIWEHDINDSPETVKTLIETTMKDILSVDNVTFE